MESDTKWRRKMSYFRCSSLIGFKLSLMLIGLTGLRVVSGHLASHPRCPTECTCTPSVRHSNLIHISCTNVLLSSLKPPPPETQAIFFNNVQAKSLQKTHLISIDTISSYLTTITWTDSGIYDIPGGTFIGLTCLKHLNLKGNHITNFQAIDDINGLIKLDLTYNDIKEINITFADSLIEIKLDYNQIYLISNTSFSDLLHLKYLSLAHNHLKNIENGLFENLVSLEYLDIHNNDIDYLEENSLINLRKLKYLNIAYNNLKNLPQLVFHNCRLLKILNLRENHLKNFNGGHTYGLVSIRTIILKNNNLSELASGTFYYTKKLKHLDVSQNNLTTIPESIQDLKLKTIITEGNKLQCNCKMTWFIKWVDKFNVTFNGTERICPTDIANLEEIQPKDGDKCKKISAKKVTKLIFELGHKAILECNTPTSRTRAIWKIPTGELLIGNIDRHKDGRVSVYDNGSLIIRRVLRNDCGLYTCILSDIYMNKTSHIVIQLDPITFFRIKINSILAGIISAMSFLIITIAVQMIKKLVKRCCKTPPEEETNAEGRQLFQLIETIDQYKTQQLEKLRENYKSQVHKIKDNCVQQVEWICDSYQNQMQNLKDIRDYGTSHLSSMKEQYYDQVKRVREYSNSQLSWVRENYVFQRNRIRKFSTHQALRFRESYKYQQQTLNKLLENLPSLHLENCKSGSCSKNDTAGASGAGCAEDMEFEVYVKTQADEEGGSVYYTGSELSESPRVTGQQTREESQEQ